MKKAFFSSFLIYLFPAPVAHAAIGPLLFLLPAALAIPVIGLRVLSAQGLAFLIFFVLFKRSTRLGFLAGIPAVAVSLFVIFYWPWASLLFHRAYDTILPAEPKRPLAVEATIDGFMLLDVDAPSFHASPSGAWIQNWTDESLSYKVLTGPSWGARDIKGIETGSIGNNFRIVYGLPDMTALASLGKFVAGQKVYDWFVLRPEGDGWRAAPLPASIPIETRKNTWNHRPILSRNGNFVAWADLDDAFAYPLAGGEMIKISLISKLGFPRGYELLDFDSDKKRVLVRRRDQAGNHFYELDFDGNIVSGPMQTAGMEKAFEPKFIKLDQGWISWCPEPVEGAPGTVVWEVGGVRGRYKTSGPRDLVSVSVDPGLRLLALREAYGDTSDPLKDKLKILRLPDGKVVHEQDLSANAGEPVLFLRDGRLVYMEEKPGDIPVLCVAAVPANL